MTDFRPIVIVRSLKTFGESFFFAYRNRRRLLPVVVGVFLLNLALTELMVNLASPHINLDYMRPFFELADNSTESADGMVVVFHEEDRSWMFITAVGGFFFALSTIVAILFFSKACNYELPEGQRPANFPFSLKWREWKSFGLLLFLGADCIMVVSMVLEALDLDDTLCEYFRNYLYFFYLLTAVVSSKEGLYFISAAKKAWVLVSEKFYEINVLYATTYIFRQILDAAYTTEVFLPGKEVVAANVIREDTAAEIFRFSVVAALLTVILQTFKCSMILTFYINESERPTDRQRDGNDATAVIAATHAQPRPEAEAIRRAPAASGGSDASSSNGGRALNLDTRTPRPRRQTRPHPNYDPRVWQL